MASDQGSRFLEDDSNSESQYSASKVGLGGATHETKGSAATTPSSSSESFGLESPQSQASPFLFINTHEKNGKQKAESRMLVRSHVMSTFYRKKSTSQSQAGTPPRELDAGGQTGKFRLETYPRRRRAKRRKDQLEAGGEVIKNENSDIVITIPREIQGSGPLDPFAVAALPWNSNMQKLVRHYVADIPDSIHPLKYSSYHVQNFILKIGITDAALLHAILAYAMVHKFCFGQNTSPTEAEKLEYVSSNPEVLDHKTQAIHIVNQKIALGEADDPSIATVLLLLWQYPWIQESGEHEALIHYTGLKQMVQCRGGLEKLPTPIANSIRFHSLKRSMLSWSKPHLPTIVSTSTGSLAGIQVPIANHDSIFFHSPTYFAPLLGKELWQILIDLNYFTAFVSYYRSHQTEFGPEESIEFEHWNAALETRLLSYTPPEHEVRMCDDSFKEALRLAAVLWMSTGLWSFPLATSLVSSMAGQLVNVLIRSDLASWRKRVPDILLWILVIGACCTVNEGPGKAFLLGHLQLMIGVRRFESSDDLFKAMRCFIYMDGAYAEPIKTLWRDITEDGLG